MVWETCHVVCSLTVNISKTNTPHFHYQHSTLPFQNHFIWLSSLNTLSHLPYSPLNSKINRSQIVIIGCFIFTKFKPLKALSSKLMFTQSAQSLLQIYTRFFPLLFFRIYLFASNMSHNMTSHNNHTIHYLIFT